jgi:hypothetical protein
MESPKMNGITSPCFFYYISYFSNLQQPRLNLIHQPSLNHSTNSGNTASVDMANDSFPTEYTYVNQNLLSDHH